MNVSYVTMVFPALTETFAGVDVRVLRESGVTVSVYALRSAQPWGRDKRAGLFTQRARAREVNRLLAVRGLGDLAVSHSTPWAVLRGVAFAIVHLSLLVDLIGWLWRHNRRSPRHFLKSVVMVPRSLDIFAAIRRARPDVVHLFWGHYPSIVGYLVRRYLPEIVVSMFLGAYDLRERYAGSAALGRLADVVWTHAHVNTPVMEELGVPRRHIRVMHRGIDVESFLPRRGEKVPYRLITAGRLSVEKGVHHVLALFAKARQRWPDASLVVLGDGPERARLTALAESLGIRSAVTFLGHVGPEDVRREMAAAQLFVHMAAVECLPNAVKEAMASGCACVVSETPGIEELVEDGVSGFVVPNADVDAATHRVDELFRHPERITAMAAAARDRIAAEFDVRRAMRTYRDCWSGLLQRRRHYS
jgi:glycosyltransferase involved in cell wall biosynthesis